MRSCLRCEKSRFKRVKVILTWFLLKTEQRLASLLNVCLVDVSRLVFAVKCEPQLQAGVRQCHPDVVFRCES